MRLLMVLGGLPEPQVNYILRELNGDWSQRLDLCYPELKLIVEYDGRHHSEVRANWLKDIKRREALERDGWRVVIVTAEGLYDEPLDTLQRVRLALNERAGASAHAGSRRNGTGSSPTGQLHSDTRPPRKSALV